MTLPSGPRKTLFTDEILLFRTYFLLTTEWKKLHCQKTDFFHTGCDRQTASTKADWLRDIVYEENGYSSEPGHVAFTQMCAERVFWQKSESLSLIQHSRLHQPVVCIYCRCSSLLQQS